MHEAVLQLEPAYCSKCTCHCQSESEVSEGAFYFTGILKGERTIAVVGRETSVVGPGRSASVSQIRQRALLLSWEGGEVKVSTVNVERSKLHKWNELRVAQGMPSYSWDGVNQRMGELSLYHLLLSINLPLIIINTSFKNVPSRIWHLHNFVQ